MIAEACNTTWPEATQTIALMAMIAFALWTWSR